MRGQGMVASLEDDRGGAGHVGKPCIRRPRRQFGVVGADDPEQLVDHEFLLAALDLNRAQWPRQHSWSRQR